MGLLILCQLFSPRRLLGGGVSGPGRGDRILAYLAATKICSQSAPAQPTPYPNLLMFFPRSSHSVILLATKGDRGGSVGCYHPHMVSGTGLATIQLAQDLTVVDHEICHSEPSIGSGRQCYLFSCKAVLWVGTPRGGCHTASF